MLMETRWIPLETGRSLRTCHAQQQSHRRIRPAPRAVCCKSPQRRRQDKMRCNRLRISIPSRPNSENLRALRNILAGEAALLILASSHNERRAIPTRMAYDEPTPHLTEFKQGGYLVRSQPPLNVELAEPRQTDCGSSSPGQCSLQRYR
jgi:hypothetical protein